MANGTIAFHPGPNDQLISARRLTLIFEDYVPPHYALIPNAAEFTVEHLLARMNIQTIPYDPADGHKEVLQILERLHSEAPYNIPAPA